VQTQFNFTLLKDSFIHQSYFISRVKGNEEIRKEIAYEYDYIIKQVAIVSVRMHLPS
jgi:hypothetical protein